MLLATLTGYVTVLPNKSLHDEVEARQRLRGNAGDAVARLPDALFDGEIAEIVEVSQEKLADVPRIADRSTEVDRGAPVALVEEMGLGTRVEQRQAAVHAAQTIAQHPTAARQEDAGLIRAPAHTEHRSKRVPSSVDRHPSASSPTTRPSSQSQVVNADGVSVVRRSPCRTRVVERERRIVHSRLQAPAVCPRSPLSPQPAFDETRRFVGIDVAFLVDVAFEVDLRVGANAPGKIRRRLEGELRESEARHVLEAAGVVALAAVARLRRAAIDPARRSSRPHQPQIDESAERERRFLLDVVGRLRRA